MAAEKGDCEVVDRLLAAKAAVEALDRFRRGPWGLKDGTICNTLVRQSKGPL